MSQKPPVSAGLEFLSAMRALDRVVTGKIEKLVTEVRKKGFFGVTVADITTLHAIYELEDITKQPSEISKMSMIHSGALTRSLKGLEESDLVSLEKKDGKVVTVNLSEDARTIAQAFKKALDSSIEELVTSDQARSFSALIARHGNL